MAKKGSFPSEDAVLKALYLRITELYKKWNGRPVSNRALVRKNYFDIVSFSGKKWQSPYKNPRNGKQNENNSFPITGSHGSCSDYIIPGVSMGFPLLFVF